MYMTDNIVLCVSVVGSSMSTMSGLSVAGLIAAGVAATVPVVIVVAYCLCRRRHLAHRQHRGAPVQCSDYQQNDPLVA